MVTEAHEGSPGVVRLTNAPEKIGVGNLTTNIRVTASGGVGIGDTARRTGGNGARDDFTNGGTIASGIYSFPEPRITSEG